MTGDPGGRRARALSPHLSVRDADAAVDFYRRASGAVELHRNVLPTGLVLYLELALGDCRLQLGEEVPALNACAPADGDVPLLLALEFDDVDGVARGRVRRRDGGDAGPRGVVRGAPRHRPRPCGDRWALVTSRQELTPDELRARTPPDPVGDAE